MEIIQVLANVILISLLGILVAFNPMLIAVDVVLVLRSRRPILNTVLLIGGFTLSLMMLFIVSSLLIDPDSEVSLRKIKSNLDLPPFIDMLAGSLLLGWALKRYLRPTAKPKIKRSNQLKVPEGPFQLFSFAFIKALLSATNLFAILALARFVASGNWGPLLGAAAIIWLLLIGVIPMLAIMYYWLFRRESLVSLDKRINSLISRDTDKIITYAAGTLGAVFLAAGILGVLR